MHFCGAEVLFSQPQRILGTGATELPQNPSCYKHFEKLKKAVILYLNKQLSKEKLRKTPTCQEGRENLKSELKAYNWCYGGPREGGKEFPDQKNPFRKIPSRGRTSVLSQAELGSGTEPCIAKTSSKLYFQCKGLQKKYTTTPRKTAKMF